MKSFYDCFDDPDEKPHIVALMSDGGSEARARYGEWLRLRGDARAELVLTTHRLLVGVEADGERRALALRAIELAAECDPMWLKLILQPILVRNCGQATDRAARARFRFECPESWAAMRPTDDARVRFYDSCACAVVRCDSLADAEKQARLGGCIAIDNQLMSEASNLYCRNMTGQPDLFALWAERLFS